MDDIIPSSSRSRSDMKLRRACGDVATRPAVRSTLMLVLRPAIEVVSRAHAPTLSDAMKGALAWPASPLKTASTRSTTASNWCCWPATAPARSRQGAPITIDRDNDKNPVVALREIADETLSPDDLKEDLIHSLQKHVEVDEPEADGRADRRPDRRRGPARRRRAEDDSIAFDRMSEEDLLAGIEGLVPPEKSDDD